MANSVIEKTMVASVNIDSYNRVAKATSNMVNGTPVTLVVESEAGSEVFTATKAGAGVKNVWMVASPEVTKQIIGNTYTDLDPREFINFAGKPMDIIYPLKTDVYKVNKEFFVEDKDPDTVTGATVVELTASGYEAKVSATAEYDGFGFKILKKAPMVIANYSVATDEVDAWLIEVSNN